jgi:hypothetical protein
MFGLIILESMVAFVSWNFSVSLILVVEALIQTVLFSIIFLPVGDFASWVSNMLTRSTSISHVVYVAFIVIGGANTWNRGSVVFHILGLGLLLEIVVALSVLLSSNISHLLSKKTSILGKVVPLVIMWAPKLEV